MLFKWILQSRTQLFKENPQFQATDILHKETLFNDCTFFLSFDTESNLASGETCVTDLSTAGGQERQTLHSLVHEIQQSLLELMHACWHRNADQRPKPMELLKSANSGGCLKI